MPLAMHEKAEKMKHFHIIVVLIVTEIQHSLLYYIIKQTVEPDGEVQLEVRCLCSNPYSDKAYGLKCKQISLLPQLPCQQIKTHFHPTTSSEAHICLIILYIRVRNRKKFTILTLIKLIKTPQPKIIRTTKYNWQFPKTSTA